jgi:aspartyl-tRNA(Asn)/glutamyl-tRNA(Gln) amidotransferase subunit A
VQCCATFDAVLAGKMPPHLVRRPIAQLKLGALTTTVLDGLDGIVADAYDRALATLRAAGATIVDFALPLVAQIPDLFKNGGISIAEAYRFHRPMLDRAQADYDPIVARRLRVGSVITNAEYEDLLRRRNAMIAEAATQTRQFAAVIMPSCPIVAPSIASVTQLDAWQDVHRRLLYPNAIANVLDRCALTLPLQPAGEPPVGLTIMGESMADRSVLTIGHSVEQILRP